MTLKKLLDLLDPMTPLRIVPLREGYCYFTTPMDLWKCPRDDNNRTVAQLKMEIKDDQPVLDVFLVTEAYLQDQERIERKFRPAGREIKETD